MLPKCHFEDIQPDLVEHDSTQQSEDTLHDYKSWNFLDNEHSMKIPRNVTQAEDSTERGEQCVITLSMRGRPRPLDQTNLPSTVTLCSILLITNTGRLFGIDATFAKWKKLAK